MGERLESFKKAWELVLGCLASKQDSWALLYALALLWLRWCLCTARRHDALCAPGMGGRGLARAAAHCSRQSVWARAGPEQSSLPEVGLEVPLSPDTRQDHPQLERFPFPNTPIALDCRPSFLFRSSLWIVRIRGKWVPTSARHSYIRKEAAVSK